MANVYQELVAEINQTQAKLDETKSALDLERQLRLLDRSTDPPQGARLELPTVREVERVESSPVVHHLKTSTTTTTTTSTVAPLVPPRPQQLPKEFLDRAEQPRSRPVNRKRLFLILFAGLGWLFFTYAVSIRVVSTIHTSYVWVCSFGATADAAGERYPDDALKAPLTVLFPIQKLPINRALRLPCQTPMNMSAVTRRLMEGDTRTPALIYTDSTGMLNFLDVRNSLKSHIISNGLDYLCAQALDIPLCYCLAVGALSTHRPVEWIDVLGRVNLTCLGTGSTIYSQEYNSPPCSKSSETTTQRRFGSACLEYGDLSGVRHEQSVRGAWAVVAQQIFELHRGWSPCDANLDRTLAAFHNENAVFS